MKRKTSAFLVVLALLGAGATAFLLILASGDEGGLRMDDNAEGLARQDGGTHRGANGGGGRKTEGPDGIVRVPGRTPGGHKGGRQGGRIPHDSEETRLARLENSTRVEELLRDMMREENRFKRHQMNEELKKLLQALGDNVDPAVRARLLEMLTSVPQEWRHLVGDALGCLKGDTATADGLVELLRAQPDNRYTRHAIYAALGRMGVKSIAPKLLEMLGEGQPDEYMLVQTLGQIGGKEVYDDLFARLDGTLRRQTRRAIEKALLAAKTYPGLMDKVAKALDKAEPEARRSLLRVLAASKKPEHFKEVRDLLARETDPEARRAAIEALGRFGDEASARTLLDLVEGGSGMEQRRAVQSMHQIKNPKTIDLLAERWGGLDKDGRLAVMGAGARLPMPGEKLNKIAREEGLHDAEMRVRSKSAQLLGRRGKDENVDALVEFLSRAKHPSERSTALTALTKIETKKAAEEAMRALRSVPMSEKQRDAWLTRFEKIYDRFR